MLREGQHSYEVAPVIQAKWARKKKDLTCWKKRSHQDDGGSAMLCFYSPRDREAHGASFYPFETQKIRSWTWWIFSKLNIKRLIWKVVICIYIYILFFEVPNTFFSAEIFFFFQFKVVKKTKEKNLMAPIQLYSSMSVDENMTKIYMERRFATCPTRKHNEVTSSLLYQMQI